MSVYGLMDRVLAVQKKFKVLEILKLSMNYMLHKGGKYFDHLNAYQVLKEDSAFWTLFQTYYALGKSEFIYV